MTEVDSVKSYLDLVNDCDSFPYDDPFQPKGNHWLSIYQFFIGDDPRAHGFMLVDSVKKMPWTEDFEINHETRTVHLRPIQSVDASTAYTSALSRLIQRVIDEGTFRVVGGRHSEPYPIMGARFPVSLERFSSTLFGIISRGAHLTAYTKTSTGIKIWVPRRSANLFTYPNCLDTTVAGGVAAGESPLECIVREADEEASLPENFVRTEARACGTVSYIGQNGARGGGEMGLLTPNILYVYDLELSEDVTCQQNDEEVKEFYLMTTEEVKEALIRGEFKTNCALVMIDFFIRHGITTEENEVDYAEIMARLHRRLPFPTRSD